MAINTEELRLIVNTIIPENIQTNHIFFSKIFDVFFDYISDTYKLGSDSHLLLETDKELWNGSYSTLNNVDLSGIKEELVKTYLHDYNIFFDKLKTDESIRFYLNKLYEELNLDRQFDTTNLLDMINEEEFLIHKKFSQQKTIPIMFNYIADLVDKSGIGQFDEDESHFRMYEGTNYNPRRAFAYTVDTSLFKPIYMSAIKPFTHPLGFSFNYFKQLELTSTEYFNMTTAIEDYKLYVMDGTLTINTYGPSLNELPNECVFDPAKGVPQVKVKEDNTISLYGTNKTDIAGSTFIRTSDNTYKLVSDGLEQFEGEIFNCKLLDWNLDTQSYVLYEESNSDEDIRRDLYGGMISYESINTTLINFEDFADVASLGPTIGEIVVPYDNLVGVYYNNVVLNAFYDVVSKTVWIKVWNSELGTYVWKRSQYLGMDRDFITFKSNESMYSLEALQLSNYNDKIRIYSMDKDKVFNPYGGCISFFITLLDTDDIHYVVSARKLTSTALSHSIFIEKGAMTIYEANGTTSTVIKDFVPNQRYHIVFNWDNTGRNVYINGERAFIKDENGNYNEKVYIENVNTASFVVDEYLSFNLNLVRKSLNYTNFLSYIDTKTIEFKVDYKKGNTVLFENTGGYNLQTLYNEIQDIIDTVESEIVSVQNQLLRVTTLSKDQTYITNETLRVNNLIAQAKAYIYDSGSTLAYIKNIDVEVGILNLKLQDLIIENDEANIKTMFDNIVDETINYDYVIPNSEAAFEYYTEVNELIIGTPEYYEEQGMSKANYILDNFDIINKPLNLVELLEIFKDHDSFVKSVDFANKGLELLWSQDRKIFEHYHNEMETVDQCFTPWYIGDDYAVGLDNNLLLLYYNNMNNCGLVYDVDDCSFGDYLEHPKSKVDSSLEYSNGTDIYDNVIGVSEIEENGKPKLIAYLNNNTRIEYVKGVYWRHYNNENGTIIEEKSKNTIMDYSYQIRVVGTATNDGTKVVFDGSQTTYVTENPSELFFTLYQQFGEVDATVNEELELKSNLNRDPKTRTFYSTSKIIENMTEIQVDVSYLLQEETEVILYSMEETYFDTIIYRWEDMLLRVRMRDEVTYTLNDRVYEYFYDKSIVISGNEDGTVLTEEELYDDIDDGPYPFIGDNEWISASITEGFGFQQFKKIDGVYKEVLSNVIINNVPNFIKWSSSPEEFVNSCGVKNCSDGYLTKDYPTMDMTFTQADYHSTNAKYTVNYFPTISGSDVTYDLVENTDILSKTIVVENILIDEVEDLPYTSNVEQILSPSFLQADFLEKDKLDGSVTIYGPIVTGLTGVTPTYTQKTIQY